jgi:replicative DNA helicase
MEESKRKGMVRRPVTGRDSFDDRGKLPPSAIDMEAAVLGALILESDCYHKVSHFLAPNVFYKEGNSCIYAAIQSLHAKGAPVDLLSVTMELRATGKLEVAGGPFAITQMTSRVASSANASYIHYAYDESIDAFALAEKAMETMEEINTSIDSNKQDSTKSIIQRTKDSVIQTAKGNRVAFLRTGNEQFDNLIGLAQNEILMIAGPAGSGKTRYLIFLMKSILDAYPNVSINWFSFEDPADKMIRCFSGVHMLMKEEKIKGKRVKLNAVEIKEFEDFIDNTFSHYDIEFVEDLKFIKQVNNEFAAFCKKREGRFNICIIDNILLLEDNTNDRDDIIGKELVKMRKRTGGLIIPVHHFNDEQMNKEQIKAAYRPRLVHLKGRESYRRTCTQIVLMNKPGNYPDLVAEYRGWEDIMRMLLLLEVAKNRDGSANDDSVTLIREYCDLDLINFKEI